MKWPFMYKEERDAKGGKRHKHKSLLSSYGADRKQNKPLSLTVYNRCLKAPLKYMASHHARIFDYFKSKHQCNIKETYDSVTVSVTEL